MATLSPSQRIVNLLRSSGPLSPGEVMIRLELSQPTLYRSIKAQPEKTIALGGRRNRKVAALRAPKGLNSETPVFMVDPEGDIHGVGRIFTFHPAGLAFLPDNSPTSPRFYSALPAFLLDARPQGYLGRAFAERHADLGLPPTPEGWSTDETLSALARRGEDLPGNILIGEESFHRFQSLRAIEPSTIPEDAATAKLLSLASAPQSQTALLGGNQPKFTALIEGRRGPRSVVVKFALSGDSLSAVRRRDLVLCEWLALEALRDAGIQAASTRLLGGEGGVLLESERYDREGAFGRKRVLSFAALGALPPGAKGSWASTAAQLAQEQKISLADLEAIRKLECFARLIGHTARQSGDLSFVWAAGESQASLAPLVGISPSHFARSPGETDRPFPVPLCDPKLLHHWKRTIPIALNFWESVLEDVRISADFRGLAEEARKMIVALR